jgi:protein-disulfide isomerase
LLVSPVDSDSQDLTRKQRREQARAERRAIEEAEMAQAVRRRRLAQLGILGAIVVVAVVIIAVAAGGSSGTHNTPPPTNSPAERAAIAEVTSSGGGISGIPQNGNTLGSAGAPVTIAYFGDLQCPFCGEFTRTTLRTLIQKYVRTGKLRIEYRSMETATAEPEVFRTQQIAAEAAGKQNKQWWYLELFYHFQGKENSGYVNEAFLQRIARDTPGLDIAKWQSERGSSELANQLVTDAQTVSSEGFTGTPSFLIGTTGGALKKLEASATETGPFEQAIEAQLKG